MSVVNGPVSLSDIVATHTAGRYHQHPGDHSVIQILTVRWTDEFENYCFTGVW